jgi:hypothetical protein
MPEREQSRGFWEWVANSSALDLVTGIHKKRLPDARRWAEVETEKLKALKRVALEFGDSHLQREVAEREKALASVKREQDAALKRLEEEYKLLIMRKPQPGTPQPGDTG